MTSYLQHRMYEEVTYLVSIIEQLSVRQQQQCGEGVPGGIDERLDDHGRPGRGRLQADGSVLQVVRC